MSLENPLEELNKKNENINIEENVTDNQNKTSNKRRRKELIDFDNEENEENKNYNNNDNNEFKIIENENIKEKNINEIENNKENNEMNKFRTQDKNQNSHSPFKNNLLIQEKLKKIFLNRDKIKFKYTKQELPDNLKYHSDDSDNSEEFGIRHSKILKEKNNNNKKETNNLSSNISGTKYKSSNSYSNTENINKINKEDEIKISGGNKNKDFKSRIKNEEINEDIKRDLTKNYNDINIKKEIIESDENKIKKEESSEKNKNKEIILSQKNEEINNEIVLNENNKDRKYSFNSIKKYKNNNEIKSETKKNEIVNNQSEKEMEVNYRNKNKLTININNQNKKEKNEPISHNEKLNDIFDIIGKLKQKQSESVTNKNTKKKLDIIKFPKHENNNIGEEIKSKNKKTQNLNIFLTRKESQNNIQKKEEIETIDLSNKKREINITYSSKAIPHNKYKENKNYKNNNKVFINKNKNIPTRKTTELNRYKNNTNENSIDIELNTTPSSHLDRSFDAINAYNKKNISKEKRSPNVYKPKKINNNNKLGKNKETKVNAIIPNQNIIYNNFNNFFNSPEFYRNNTKNAFHKKNQKSFNEYNFENENRDNNDYIREENIPNVEAFMNQQEINNSFDGYMYQNIKKINNFNENEFIYYGNYENNEKINNLPRCNNNNVYECNNNRKLVLNNLSKIGNNNKSFGNIFKGINNQYNNNIFDTDYIANEYLGNFSTKNNSIQNPKFITYNILNPSPSQNNYPFKTVLNMNNSNNNINNIYQNINSINNVSRRGTTPKISNCIYNNKYNNIYSNNNNSKSLFNSNSNVNIKQNKNKQNTSINIEDLLILEEKINEIIIALNQNRAMHYECFEFWNYYYNCSLLGQLEKVFKSQNDKINAQISINHILISIMICYDYSYEIDILNGDFSLLEDILNLSHKILMVIYEHILSKISSESKSNIWVFKLRNLIKNFNNNSNNNDYFKNSSQMTSVEKIIYNTSAIVQNIRVLLKNYKTRNISYLTSIFKKISEKSYEEIDTYFREYIFRVDNFNGSVLASVFLKENENFKTEPAPYIHTKNRKQYSLILDLDETLIHFKLNNEDDSEGVLQIRPGVISFLEEVGKYYELIVFTAATQDYGDLLIDAIEENNVYFEHRFYRQHTIIIGNDFVKDLNRIGRPLDKIIIVDNMPQNFRLQKENGINIKAFWGEDTNDTALKELGIILVKIAIDGGDVRKGIIRYKDDIIRKVTSNIYKSNY